MDALSQTEFLLRKKWARRNGWHETGRHIRLTQRGDGIVWAIGKGKSDFTVGVMDLVAFDWELFAPEDVFEG